MTYVKTTNEALKTFRDHFGCFIHNHTGEVIIQIIDEDDYFAVEKVIGGELPESDSSFYCFHPQKFGFQFTGKYTPEIF